MATNVYLLDKAGNPLMPCHNGGFIRNILKNKKAKVVNSKPFTVQLLYDIRNRYVQPVTLGVDSGYTYIGFSASSESAELYSAEIKQDSLMVERNKERRMYRRQRRNRLRHRKARWNNRTSSKKPGWIAPSLRRKRDTHINEIMKIVSIVPVSAIIVEIGLFDPALLKATIEGKVLQGEGYQHGESEGFENMKSYIRYRDKYTCQNPDCTCHKMKPAEREKLRLFVHHLGYWKNDRTNRPGNLITLCELSHTPENHEPGGLLYGWKPKTQDLKETAFMNIVRIQIVDTLKAIYPDKDIRYTYGYVTNLTRSDWHIDKSHHDDAFCIAGHHAKQRADTLYFEQRRRNNRSLEIFYDAKYIDNRDGKKKSGKMLFNGRTTRSKVSCSENLHHYRMQKVSKGKRNIRRQHYIYQPNDVVIFGGYKYKVKGTHCNGTRVILDNGKSVAITKIQIHRYNRGVY